MNYYLFVLTMLGNSVNEQYIHVCLDDHLVLTILHVAVHHRLSLFL